MLESILGGPPRNPVANKRDSAIEESKKPAEVIEDIDFGGLSLQEFAAADTPDVQHSSPIHTYSAQSVEECTCSYIPTA